MAYKSKIGIPANFKHKVQINVNAAYIIIEVAMLFTLSLTYLTLLFLLKKVVIH